MSTPTIPSPHQIAQATATLDQVKRYLRTGPPLADALHLLEPLLDEDSGVPILLGDILRGASRLVSEQTDHPMDHEVRLTMRALREAAEQATDWYTLHYDIQQLTGRLLPAAETASTP
ncbi:hypothetical protein [Actinacidiphila sp. bgisy144]|uniref:hypothetical protein n=1 Tax=Actinacidiphila sp. bgisy144 TaxID=3413791 RepID=UPI003EB72A9A